MRIFIGSDIHGSATSLEKFFGIVDKALADDMDTKVVLLGDTYNHGPRNPFPEGYAPMQVAKLLNDAMTFVTVIQGNCDSEVDQMISNFPIIGDFEMQWTKGKVFFTHGHKVNSENPPTGAKSGDIVFFGHFHTPSVTVVDGITYVCVGSIGMNKVGEPKTFVELLDDKFEIKTFDGDVIQSVEF